jgi:hypothetical protein
MNLIFGGISEGVFAFFIIFCTLVGMATGAYLMDKRMFIQTIKYIPHRVRANLQNLISMFRHLPDSKYCLINRHDYVQKMFGEDDRFFFFYTNTCIKCNKEGSIQVVIKNRIKQAEPEVRINI